MATKVIIANQKGGVGKTTTAHALATGLTYKGYKTLVIDADPQCNMSYTMGADISKAGTHEILTGTATANETIQKTPQGDIIVANLSLATLDMELTEKGKEYRLDEALKPIINDYDFIIVDTPPTLGMISINALTTADNVIIPLGADIYSLQGLGQLYNTINKVKQYSNPNLYVAGLLITRYNKRTILSRDLKDLIEEKSKRLETTVFKTYIRESISVKEAQTKQESLFTYAPKNNATYDYSDFIIEYIKRLDKRSTEK